MWTRFMDMHSGGDQKEKWSKILIEAPMNEAISVFFSRFGHNPSRVTCTCCGVDYSVSEDESLEQITAYDRGCTWSRKTEKYEETQATNRLYEPYKTLDEYLASGDVLVIRAKEIRPEEREADVPQQGYVWVD